MQQCSAVTVYVLLLMMGTEQICVDIVDIPCDGELIAI